MAHFAIYAKSSKGETGCWVYQHGSDDEDRERRILKQRKGRAQKGTTYKLIKLDDQKDAPHMCEELPVPSVEKHLDEGTYHVTRRTNTDPWIVRTETGEAISEFDLLGDVRDYYDLESTSRGIGDGFQGLFEEGEFTSIHHFIYP